MKSDYNGEEVIQCTKTVFNQYKWSRQLLVLTPLPSNVGALFSAMTLQTTKLQDGDLCSSAIRNSRPPARSEGWRWPSALKVTTGETQMATSIFSCKLFSLHFKRYQIHTLTFKIWLCLRHTMSNNPLKSFFRFDEFVVTYIIDDLVYEF